MDDSPRKPASGNADDRRVRQAEQLRENLRRRKEQARARQDSGPPGGEDGAVAEEGETR